MVENLKQLLPFIIDTNNPLVQNKTNVTDGIAATIYILVSAARSYIHLGIFGEQVRTLS